MTDLNVRDRRAERPVGKTDRWGPWMGVAFVVFVAISIATGNTPESSASGTKVVEFYTKHRTETIVSLCAVLLGVVAGSFFFAYLYSWLRKADRGWVPVVQIMAATIFMTAGLLAGGANLMLADQGRHLAPDVAKAVNVVGEDFWALVGSGGVGITMLAVGLSMLHRTVASKWWAVGALVAGVVSIVGWFLPFGLILAVIWILAFSIRLLRRDEPLGDLTS